jgi:predicted nuclease of predicted toxin-antitoxin system
LKLLVDEMYPPAIAEQLREGKHDVEAVTERTDRSKIGQRALPDIDIFALAQQEQRAVVTENIADFSVIADGCDLHGQAHHGLVLVPPGSHPRGSPGTIGRMVTALDRLLREHPGETPTSLRHWL